MKIIAMIPIFFVSSFCIGQNLHKNFIYGINGHPLNQDAYMNNLNLQIKLIKDLHCKYYRVDVPLDSNGFVSKPEKFLSLIKTFKKNSIKILPVLVFHSSVYSKNNINRAYENGFNYGSNFIRLYGRYFNYYEVGNEEGSKIIIGPEVDGNHIQHFDSLKVKLAMPYFKGVCDAIKKKSPIYKIIINETWVHYGFFEYLKLYKVNYDIIGYHAYSDMGDVNKATRGFGNVINYLANNFKKQIWITEINSRYNISNSKSNNWFVRNLHYLYNNANVKAVFVYELFDQPAYNNPQSAFKNPGEASYGINMWEYKYSKVKKKEIWDNYKSFILKHN
jgi:hypothetical protein